MKRRLTSLLLVFVLVTSLLLPASAASVELDLAAGDLWLSSYGYKRSEADPYTPHFGAYRLIQSTEECSSRIVIESGTQMVTLQGPITLNALLRSEMDVAPIEVRPGAQLNLEAMGSVTLTGGSSTAAIEVPAGSVLNLTTDAAQMVCSSNVGSAAIGGSQLGSKVPERSGTGSINIYDANLKVTAKGGGAAIGGAASFPGTEDNGFITILDSVVDARATGGGAAIGGGRCKIFGVETGPNGHGTGKGGRIEISGTSTVTALAQPDDTMGGYCGAAIGGGYGGNGVGETGRLLISGTSTVNATALGGGAAIGGGKGLEQPNTHIIDGCGTSTGGSIEITGNAVISARTEPLERLGYLNGTACGAALGGGAGATGILDQGALRITDNAVVTAETSGLGAAIGGGYQERPGNVLLPGLAITGTGSITISGSAQVDADARAGAAIGSACGSDGIGGQGALLITGDAVVTADSQSGSAIGGGQGGHAFHDTGEASIKIAGNAAVTATSHTTDLPAAAIGGVSPYPDFDSQSTIWIAGGHVTAVSMNDQTGVGIGNALDPEFSYPELSHGTLLITGGDVTARGAAALGHMNCINVTGGCLHLNSGENTLSWFGSYTPFSSPMGGDAWINLDHMPDFGKTGFPDFKSGVITCAIGEGRLYGTEVSGVTSYVLPFDAEIPFGKNLHVKAGESLIVPAGKTLTVNGQLFLDGGTLDLRGDVVLGEFGVIHGWAHTHDPQEVPGVEPTNCNEHGIYHHWICKTCHETFRDEACTQVLEDIMMPLNGHIGPLCRKDQKMPTCQTTEPIGALYCRHCQEIFEEDPSLITALGGHIFDKDGNCVHCKASRASLLATADGWIRLAPADGKTSCVVGDLVTLDVVLDKNPGVTSFGLELYFEDEQFQLEKVIDKGILAGAKLDPSYQSCPYGLFWLDNTAKTDNTQTGVIAQVQFRCIAGSADASDIQIGYYPGNMRNHLGEQVNFGVEACSVMAEEHHYYYGDVNDNGTVDSADAMFLKIQTVLPLKKPVAAPDKADTFKDGTVNLLDLAILQRHVYDTDNRFPESQHLPVLKLPISVPKAPVRVTVSDYIGLPEGAFKLLVSLDSSPDIQTALLKLDYNPAHLKLVSVQNLTAGSVYCTNTPAFGKDVTDPFYILLGNGHEPVFRADADGQLLELTFRRLDMTVETTTVGISQADSMLLDERLKEIEIAASTAGTVTFAAPPPAYGDLNGDNKVDRQDELLLKKYLALPETLTRPPKSDVNGDGSVDAADLAILQCHIKKLPGFEVLGPGIKLPAPAPKVQLMVSDASAQYTEPIELFITIPNNPGIQLGRLKVDYDHTVLRPAGAEVTGADVPLSTSQSFPGYTPDAPCYVIFGHGSEATSAPVTEPMILKLTFHFKAKPTDPTEVKITAEGSELLGKGLQPIPFQSIAGSVTYLPPETMELTCMEPHKFGSGTAIDCTIVRSGPAVNSSLLVAAYDSDGRLLATRFTNVSIPENGTVSQKPAVIDIPFGTAAGYKVFLMDEAWAPLCSAVPKP